MSTDPGRYLDAQVGVLGSVLISPELAGLVVSRSRASDYEGNYRAIYTAVSEAYAEGKPADPIVILDKLGQSFRPLLLEIMDVTPTAANAETYLAMLREQAQLRSLQPLAEEIRTAPNMETARGIVAKINACLCDRPSIGGVNFEAGLLDFYERHKGDKKYIPWGFDSLEEHLFVESGDFVVLGGYPSAGKTALALTFAVKQAAAYRVGVFSLETGTGKLMDRLISSAAKVDMDKIKRNKMDQEDYAAIAVLVDRFRGKNIEFFSASGMTVQDIQAVALSHRFNIIYVDYLQIITPSREEKRTTQVTEISMALHRLAQVNGITVVALSQLSRPEKSGDYSKAPNMQSLRESGQIEQDADVIMLLYKTEPDRSNSPRELKIAKNKEGTVGKIQLDFDGKTQTFRQGYAIPQAKPPSSEPQYKQVNFTELPNDEDMPF